MASNIIIINDPFSYPSDVNIEFGDISILDENMYDKK